MIQFISFWPIIHLFQGEPWQVLGCGVEFLCTQKSYQCIASPMRGRNREEKATRNPNSQAGEVDMARQYFASNITRSYWKRGKSEILWGRKISHCEKVFANSFWNKHDNSNRRRTWACPRLKCVKERQVAYVAVVKVVKSYLVAIYPFCWVRYIWYISSWISALYFHKFPVPLFLHSLDLCTLSTRSAVCTAHRVTARFFGQTSQLLQTLNCTDTIHLNAKKEKM